MPVFLKINSENFISNFPFWRDHIFSSTVLENDTITFYVRIGAKLRIYKKISYISVNIITKNLDIISISYLVRIFILM